MKEFFDFQRNVVGGLEVLFKEIPDLGWTAMELAVKGGARFDPLGKEGLAHLLEHMVTESGTRDFPNRQALEEFEAEKELRVGWGESCLDGTTFSVVAKEERFREMIYLLFQLVFHPLLNHRLGHEKEIIKQEINRVPLPAKLTRRKVDKLLFGSHPLAKFARSTTGTLTSLAKINWQDIRECWRTFYCAGNCCLLIIGGLPSQFLGIIESLLPNSKGEDTISCPVRALSDFPPPSKTFMTASQRRLMGRTVINSDSVEGWVVLPRAAVKSGIDNIMSKVIRHILFDELRSKRPWAYSISTDSITYRDVEVVNFVCAVELGKGQEALNIIRGIIWGLGERRDLFLKYRKENIWTLELYSGHTLQILSDAVCDILTNDRIVPLKEMVTVRQALQVEDFLETAARFFSPERVLFTLLTE